MYPKLGTSDLPKQSRSPCYNCEKDTWQPVRQSLKQFTRPCRHGSFDKQMSTSVCTGSIFGHVVKTSSETSIWCVWWWRAVFPLRGNVCFCAQPSGHATSEAFQAVKSLYDR